MEVFRKEVVKFSNPTPTDLQKGKASIMSSLKLGVEVVSAHNLMPKDGQVSSNHFVELHFDGQRFRSTIKAKDLNPVWNENFYFNISDPSSLSNLHLDAYVYRDIKVKGTSSRSVLGKVRLTERSFAVPYVDAVVFHYPLEKKQGMFSRVKGELALIVYLTDEPTLKSFSNLLPTIGPSARQDQLASQTTQPQVQVSNPTPTTAPVSNDRAVSSRTNQDQQRSSTTMSQELAKYSAHGIISYEIPKTIQMLPASSQEPVDFALKEIGPYLGRGQVVRGDFMRLADKPAELSRCSTFSYVL
ncbi:C2 calcium-dependent membrane targeting [Cinnamomum micranthum f. kanehirae]|uniref:C2 calcium-dependent membrane targeting n=1 Tax=Cinnamomum micranthum f. kanehirae TaxID=337451 RepID=A0A3S3MXG7_9MAGN|nr:C2 calcium-dependent membrane targeting [Cinnamomum micranthum f. kanehirae]